MQPHSENTKRIAKNTLMLYGRMLFSMVVSLYTSRVVLSTLGVEDYGIYNIVGGVIAMLSFLNDSMSGATSRFLTFELGKGDNSKLKRTFSTAIVIHLCIALVILLFFETIGLWFFKNKLVIPDNRLVAAHVTYQVAIISSMLSIIQTPFNASIIAHEKMSVYAYVGILNVVLRLLIVYLLVIGNYDKLILYSILQLIVSIVIILIYLIYCRLNFAETRVGLHAYKEFFRPMLSFSGWDMFGNVSVMARTQGVSILLNMFFGPVANAAAGVATQVQSAVMAFASNIVTAVKPQLVKYYASNEYDSMFELLTNSVKLSFVLLSIITIPIIVEIDFILNLWLEIVPENTSIFCVFTLIFNLFAVISLLLATIIHATGKVKRISLINGCLYILVLPVTYFVFKHSDIIWLPYLFNTLAVSMGMLSNAWTIHLYIHQFDFVKFVKKTYLPCVILFCFVLLLILGCSQLMQQGIVRLLLSIFVSSLLLIILGYNVLLSKENRMMIKNVIVNRICKKV